MFELTNDVSGLPKPNFQGFMANVAITNYNVIRKMYDGDPNVLLKGKKHTLGGKFVNPHIKKKKLLAFQEDHITNKIIVACNCHLQLVFSHKRHLQLNWFQ
jgi:hypothetical protein